MRSGGVWLKGCGCGVGRRVRSGVCVWEEEVLAHAQITPVSYDAHVMLN